jgi:hypothetical protein
MAGALDNRGTLTLTASTLAGNSGLESVGGLFNNGLMTITSSTIADNAALRNGGLTNRGTLTMINSTIARNVALFGAGGIANGGQLRLQNSILASNMSRYSPDCSNRVTSLGHNLIGNPQGCPIRLRPSDRTGSPGLTEFSDVGAPGRGHFPLRLDSQAIDVGKNTVCPPTDQIENPRDGRCDIGAIEFQRVPAPL